MAISMSAHPGVAETTEKKVIVTSDIRYREGQSQAWYLDIAEPEQTPDTGLRPAIVIIHGGGWALGQRTTRYTETF